MSEALTVSTTRALPRTEGRVDARRGYLRAFALALLVAVVVRGFVLQAYRIPSPSMVPSLDVGDHVLTSKLSYGVRSLFGGWWLQYRQPTPGDVVVFASPADRTRPADEQRDFVKRVVAVGGETVEVVGGRVFVDGEMRDFDGTYHLFARREGREERFGPLDIPFGQVFVLGDNRDASEDSRIFGPVDVREVLGKVVLVFWSWDERDHRVRWDRIGTRVQ